MPTLPTDNLYKFIAVLGFVIVSGSGTLWLNAESTIDAAAQTFLAETEELRVQSSKYITELNKAKKFARENSDDRGMTRETRKKLLEMLNATDPLEARTNELLRRSEGPLFLYEKRLERHEYQRAAAIAGIFSGVIIFGLGMFLWKKKLQSKLDKQLEKEHAQP